MGTDFEIETFILAFEAGVWPRAEWTHARHLLMALWYLRGNSREEATNLIRTGIKRYNLAQNNPTGYHETITLAWVSLIDHFLASRDRTRPISSLADELFRSFDDTRYLFRYYSRDRLHSPEARAAWVEPDLMDLP